MLALKDSPAATPATLGYTMPAEWAPHAATWLTWPHNARNWPGKFEVIPWAFGEMIRKIADGENIRLMVRHERDARHARRVLKLAGVNLRKIQFVRHVTDRGWTRDTGPTFVKKAESGKRKAETAIVHFHFNGWAKYDDWRQDTKIPETAARVLRKKLFHAQSAPRQPAIGNRQPAISSWKAAASKSMALAPSCPPSNVICIRKFRCAIPAWEKQKSRPR